MRIILTLVYYANKRPPPRGTTPRDIYAGSSYFSSPRCPGKEEHAQHDAHGKHDSHDDGQAVKVLLHNARGRAGVIQRASNHIRDTPVPLPERIRTRIVNATAEIAENDKQKNLELTQR